MGYKYSRTVTIDHTKVPTTDQTNFPVLFSGTYAYLATTANGGNVTNSNGYDIIFTSDAAGTTKLDHEIETYTATTGAVNFWVRVPTVSHTTDTVIYLWYGNSAITTSQENKTGVWDSNFKGVWHLPNGTTLTANDSTSNGNNGTINGQVGNDMAGTGMVDGAGAFDGTDDYVDNGSSASLRITGNLTVSAWVKQSVAGANQRILGKTNNSGAQNSYGLSWWSNSITFMVSGNGSSITYSPSDTLSDTTNFHHIVGVYNGSSLYLYVDGVSIGTPTSYSGGIYDSTTVSLLFGSWINDSSRFHGTLDELRISNVARSADWITTEYNNQSSPSTFYTVGAETVGWWWIRPLLQAVSRAAVR